MFCSIEEGSPPKFGSEKLMSNLVRTWSSYRRRAALAAHAGVKPE